MTRLIAEEISELISQIRNLEAERDSLHDVLEKAGIYAYQIDESIRARWREENEGKLRRFEDLKIQIDAARQKLISTELVSINSYSQNSIEALQR